MAEEFDVPHRIGLVPDSNGTDGTAVFEIYIKTTPGTALGGDHRSRDESEVQLRRGHDLRMDDRARRTSRPCRG